MRLLLRVALGALIAALIAIAAVPLLVLRDLNNGGTGWGLCEDGISTCSNSYFAGFELVAGLMVALLLVIVGLRIVTRTLRYVEHQYDRKRGAAAAAMTGPSAEPGASPDTGASTAVTLEERPR